MVGDIIDLTREGVLNELLYVDNIALISKTVKGLGNKFRKLKETFGIKGLMVNIWKTKVMSRRGISLDGSFRSKL